MPKKLLEKLKGDNRAVAVARALLKKGLPRRLVILVLLRDMSGSMSMWHNAQGEFVPALCQGLIETGGEKVADLVYILYVAVSGGVVSTEFKSLREAEDPVITLNGQTPLGAGLSTVAAKVTAFIEDQVCPAESSVRTLEFVLVSDLKPSAEAEAETQAGVKAFVDMVGKYRGKVTLVGPAPEAMNTDLVPLLNVTEREVKYLDSDPKAVLKITFDSLLQASRKLTGSDPSIVNG